jgi:fatty acyl-CoA reductase
MTERVNTKSPINDSFRNKSVLITGATGLVGKFVAYKILNSVKSVKNVYILIRSKKGKSFTQRFDDMISKSSGLFKNIDSRSLQKLIPIEGDITADGLGLKKIDRNTIIDNVSMVFHSAADVTFDTSLKYEFKYNKN